MTEMEPIAKHAHERLLRERAERHFDDAALEFAQAVRFDKRYRLDQRKALGEGAHKSMSEGFKALSELRALTGAEEV